jgi:hypothetical protein
MAKSKGTRKAAKSTAKPAGAGKLRELIGEIIDAQTRGDQEQSAAAVKALEKLEASASPQVRQRAVEARMAASNSHPQDRSRLLNELAARLGN